MGSRPSANIFYGLAAESAEELPNDIEDAFAEKKGVLDDYTAKMKLLKETGIEIILEGATSGGDFTSYIAIEESVIHGDWDGPTPVNLEKLHFKEGWRSRLKEFCDFMGFEWKEPRLIMTCAYG